MSESAKVVQPGPPPARSRLGHTALVLIDLIDMPGFNPATQKDRGDWSLRDVTAGTVTAHPREKVRCIDHGAMNCVNPERTIWRCLMCGRAAYAPRVEEVVRPVTDLVEFLRARMDEDERTARNALDIEQMARWGLPEDCTRAQSDFMARWDPTRVLAEVAAKRARLTFLAETAARCPKDDWPAEGGMEQAPMADMARYLLRMEAQPYADHPDFAPAWRLTPE